jgi:hypothetical protein
MDYSRESDILHNTKPEPCLGFFTPIPEKN